LLIRFRHPTHFEVSPVFDAIQNALGHLGHVQFVGALQADESQSSPLHVLLAGVAQAVLPGSIEIWVRR